MVNYIQLVYIVLYITRKMFPSVICPVFQSSYKFDPELFLNSESQLKFLERKNGDRLVIYSTKYCVFSHIYLVFRVAGIGMMLIISVLRYRATVHPLKPDVSRRKLKVVCGLVYIVGFIAGYATDLPLCFMQWNDVTIVYDKVFNGYTMSCFYFSQQYLWLWFIIK